jgi:hypothetical protein
MKTLYSILYMSLNTTLNERIGVGLIMSDGLEFSFKYSGEKLNALKNVIDKQKFNLIRSYLTAIESEVSCFGEAKTQLFENNKTSSVWLSESYIDYLSKYSNNIIQFSAPKIIEIEYSGENFKRVFEKYVFRFPTEAIFHSPEIDIHQKVKEELFPKINKRVNIEKTLTSNDFENLFTPIEVDFIGVNGIPVAGQTFDFNKRHYYLENDVARFVSLTKAIELEKSKGKYFVLGKEPEKEDYKNHSLWKQIRDTVFLEFVDIKDVDVIEHYLDANDVKPFFD